MEIPITEETFYCEVVPNLTLNDISELGLVDLLGREITSRSNLEQELQIAINNNNESLVRLLLNANVPIPNIYWDSIPYRSLSVLLENLDFDRDFDIASMVRELVYSNCPTNYYQALLYSKDALRRMVDEKLISIVPSKQCSLGYEVLDHIIKLNGYLDKSVLEAILEYRDIEDYAQDPELTQSLIRLLGYTKYIRID